MLRNGFFSAWQSPIKFDSQLLPVCNASNDIGLIWLR